jgi:branched-chain amino acid transport system substrate-binding protein
LHKASYNGVVTTYAYDESGNLKKAPITVYGFKAGMPTPVQ